MVGIHKLQIWILLNIKFRVVLLRILVAVQRHVVYLLCINVQRLLAFEILLILVLDLDGATKVELRHDRGLGWMMRAANVVVHRNVGRMVFWIARALRHRAIVVYFLSILVNLAHKTMLHRSWRIMIGLWSIII